MTPESTREAALREARRFHELYEKLAPQFGYETRPETRQFDPESPNGRLMIAVCEALSAPAVEAGEADTSDNVCPDCRAKFGKHVDGCVYEPNPSPSAIRLAQEGDK